MFWTPSYTMHHGIQAWCSLSCMPGTMRCCTGRQKPCSCRHVPIAYIWTFPQPRSEVLMLVASLLKFFFSLLFGPRILFSYSGSFSSTDWPGSLGMQFPVTQEGEGTGGKICASSISHRFFYRKPRWTVGQVPPQSISLITEYFSSCLTFSFPYLCFPGPFPDQWTAPESLFLNQFLKK